MRGQERKIALLTVASLLVAYFCFGLLDSTGALDQSGYKLGGAFVGFVVTFGLLARAWGPDNFEDMVVKSDADFVYDDIVKVLDLRQSPPDRRPQLAPLSDYRRAIRNKPNQNFHMHYATSGAGIDFVGSASHPQTADWREGEVTHEGPSGQTLKRQYELDIPLAEVAVGEPVVIAAEVQYRDAFLGSEQEWLETHIDEPTRHVVMLVVVPEGMRAVSAGVTVKKEGREKHPRVPEPVLMLDGSLVYWSLTSPRLDTRYALGWRWVARSPRSVGP